MQEVFLFGLCDPVDSYKASLRLEMVQPCQTSTNHRRQETKEASAIIVISPERTQTADFTSTCVSQLRCHLRDPETHHWVFIDLELFITQHVQDSEKPNNTGPNSLLSCAFQRGKTICKVSPKLFPVTAGSTLSLLQEVEHSQPMQLWHIGHQYSTSQRSESSWLEAWLF